MKGFAQLYQAIDETNKTNEKVSAMAEYFRAAPPEDAAWAASFLMGRRPKRLVSSPKLWGWAAELAGLPGWLFAECYDAVGDLAETIALALPDPKPTETRRSDSLAFWVENRLIPIGSMLETEQREALQSVWNDLDRQERFVFNKLITGAFRVGVSSDLVVRALALANGVPAAVLAHRLMGNWAPTAEFYQTLVSEEAGDAQISRPYPFCLAHPLEMEPEQLGKIEDWHAEWKWDGIRAQLIRREGQSFIWSRGEELITERFPEIKEVCDRLPDGCVIDGEILGWADGKPLKFLELQRRIGRKDITKKVLKEVPVVLAVFDILEWLGQDVRERPYIERREILIDLVDAVNALPALQSALENQGTPVVTSDTRLAVDSSVEEKERPAAVRQGKEAQIVGTASRFLLSSEVQASSWQELAEARSNSRGLNVEGLMLKRRDSPYIVGRKKGLWWKWKIEPFTVDAVMIYAQRGSGKRASLYTDYTFGVWSEGRLVPLAKAYSGLTDEEIRRVDAFVRRNTLEKFGPVRTVKPELVFELAFEAIQLSSRHKSGVAVRFPRISRWRQDKKPEDADTLDGVKDLLRVHG